MEARRAGDRHRHARARPSVGSRFGRPYVADSDYLPRMGTASGELRRRSTAGALWAFVETWGQQAIQLALFAILARLLGPEAYGVAAIAIMILIADDGLVLNAGWGKPSCSAASSRGPMPTRYSGSSWVPPALLPCSAP